VEHHGLRLLLVELEQPVTLEVDGVDDDQPALNRNLGRRVTRDRCYDFLNIFAEKFTEKIGAFCSKQS
jgi:hypothetical protein